MPAYRITLKDRSVEVVEGADAYQQEGQMTTFFRTSSGRQVIDSWSTRMASFRTSEMLAVRRLDLSDQASAGHGASTGAATALCDRPRRPHFAGAGG